MSEECKAEPVGYKCPPRDHQFRPGQSGNPGGRPKGARNFKTELREELSELVTIREGKRDVQVSKQRALIKPARRGHRWKSARGGDDAGDVRAPVRRCRRR
jgi:Family of unknown function (DUF5681)